MREEVVLTETGTDALIAICIKAMNQIRPGEHILLSIKHDGIQNRMLRSCPAWVHELRQQEAIIEDHPDGSRTIRVGSTFAVAVPENGQWKVQGFYLWVESRGFHSIIVEAIPLTCVGLLDGPIGQTPEHALARILGLFSLI